MPKIKTILEDAIKDNGGTEVDLVDRNITNLRESPQLLSMSQMTRLTLSHNKLTELPADINQLYNLEVLNLTNNHLEELPTTISTLHKLKILSVAMNRLDKLPRGFGAFPVLEVLDITYNNICEDTLPSNFFCLDTLRALYMGDNDFEVLSPEIGKLINLQIFVLRENDLLSLPGEIGNLRRLKELHIQGNRLRYLPPELGQLDLLGSKQVFKAENNPWVQQIAEQFRVGAPHVFEYITSDTYMILYRRLVGDTKDPPPKTIDKTKKASRKR